MKQTAVEFLAEQLRQLAHNPNTHLGMGDIRVTQGTIDELEQQAKEMEKENQKHIGQITEKGIIDTIGNCANCGVEFHIHKDITENQQQQGYSEEEAIEFFIEGYKQRAEKSNLIFDNASRMYAIALFKQFKNK